MAKPTKPTRKSAKGRKLPKLASAATIAAPILEPTPMPVTHESYIAQVARLAACQPDATPADRAMIGAVKLTYGAGPEGTLGITYYRKWRKPGATEALPFVAICATCQPEGSYLLAETVIHELAHACAPIGAGHGPDWVAACRRLGLV